MSWAVTTYYCQKCDFETGDLHTWGSREYVLASGVRISMTWTLGWCADCSTVCALELLDEQKRQRELAHAEKDLHALRHQPAPPSDEQVIANWNYLAGLMEDARDALRVVTDRIEPLHCLKCGGLQVTPWQTRSDEAMHPLHAPCGGSLLTREEGLRIALIPTITRYTPEGKFIEQIRVSGYSMPEWEYFAKRSEENARIRGLWTSTKPNIEPTPMEGEPLF